MLSTVIRPPHQLHQPLRDVEPKTRAAIFAGIARLQLGKRLKQLGLLLFGNADAGIAHTEADPHWVGIGQLDADFDFTAFR